ncbi:MAG: sel1 repeat family protein [Epsilonproteobacteria bacterium]|nr:sel1 repeat family protein [Campylobacterota bacterium]
MSQRYTLEEAITFYEQERYEEALEALKQHRKNMTAQYFLGMLFYEGFGVKKDEEEAKRWFKKSARQGSLDAEYMLLCCEGNTTSCCKA